MKSFTCVRLQEFKTCNSQTDKQADFSVHNLVDIFYKICKNVPPAGFQRSFILAPVADKPSQANIRLKG